MLKVLGAMWKLKIAQGKDEYEYKGDLGRSEGEGW